MPATAEDLPRAPIRTVENNPVAAGLVPRAEDWRWSSARSHVVGKRVAVDSLTDLAALGLQVRKRRAMLRRGLGGRRCGSRRRGGGRRDRCPPAHRPPDGRRRVDRRDGGRTGPTPRSAKARPEADGGRGSLVYCPRNSCPRNFP